jgi:hypothetical protein
LSVSVRATTAEASKPLPGDELIPAAAGSLTHGITIPRPPQEVWPWLAQMGAGRRAGWYSYDLLDNGRQPSATRIVPGLQPLAPGMLFPALPGITDGFILQSFEPQRSLVLGWPAPDGTITATWAFLLDDASGGTRLVVRARGSQGYRFHGLPLWASQLAIRVVHFVMQRKQLLNIEARVSQADALLDRFIPSHDIRERHSIRVQAPAAATLAAARELKLFQHPLVRAIVRGRELLMGANPDRTQRPHGLLAEALSMGWAVLAEQRDRQLVVGAVTKPWEANVTFRPIPPDEFPAFAEPGFVKIVWTLRADPDGRGGSVFSTETRAVATDAEARARFRRYWRVVSPGIKLIRYASLRPLKAAAERAPVACSL